MMGTTMKNSIFLPGTFCIFMMALTATLCAPPNWYMQIRNDFIQEEANMRLGRDLVLSDREQMVNRFLMSMKEKEIHTATYTTTPYLAAGHFFQTKPGIENTTIFKVLKKMPKGGALHLHDASVVDLNWVIKNLTYLPHLYTMNATDEHPRLLKFSNMHPGDGWELLEAMRAGQGTENVDQMLMDEWSIWTADPFNTYRSGNVIWEKFGKYFVTIEGLRSNASLAELYFNEALEEFYEDNVQYFELRDGNLWDENGEDITESYMNVAGPALEKFKADHPDFIGMKFILGGYRSDNADAVEKKVETAVNMMEKFPDLVKGFDLDSHEDVYHRILYFVNKLLEDRTSILPFFFHAGESDWTEEADMNLVDAILLNTTRIGHGFAALKHPKVMEEIKNKGIVVEVNPISNQVLGLVGDLRNHPAATFIANGFPVVISSDDHALWGASPLSHDFYMAFMAVGSTKDDMRLLKKLAINSLRYSTMTEPEKQVAMAKWTRKWDEFIEEIITEYDLKPITTSTPVTTKQPGSAPKQTAGTASVFLSLLSFLYIFWIFRRSM